MTRAFSAAAPRARRTSSSITRLIMAVALIGAAACSKSDSSTGPGNKDPVGIYPLVQVDKKPIPFEIYRETGYTVTVTGGEFVLQDDGTFHLAIDLTEDEDGDEYEDTVTADGTYRIQGTTLSIDGDGGSGTGTLRDGNVITLALELANTGKMRQYAFRLAK